MEFTVFVNRFWTGETTQRSAVSKKKGPGERLMLRVIKAMEATKIERRMIVFLRSLNPLFHTFKR